MWLSSLHNTHFRDINELLLLFNKSLSALVEVIIIHINKKVNTNKYEQKI